MKEIIVLGVVLMLVGGWALAVDWGDTTGRGMFPYWQTGSGWYTIVVFVNGSEETSDVIHLRFRSMHDSACSSTMADMFSIRAGEMLMFSTSGSVPIFIPVTAGYGYILFRVDNGEPIQGYCVVYNGMTGTGYVVPAVPQDHGF
ncbi:MAG TPA: hypothetical protein VM163_00375 [bacterium]|nr:hypothetical protein [bacterium]